MTAPARRELVDIEGRAVPRSRMPGYADASLARLARMHAQRKARGADPITPEEIDAVLGEIRGRLDPSDS